MKNNLPNFIVAGAPRCGTTSLYRYLQEHPAIYMSPQKETNFFAFKDTELNFKGPCGDRLENKSVTNIKEYKKLFQQTEEENAIGEASPAYLQWPGTAKRINDKIPNVKLIFILRNPIDRAYSDFLNMNRLNWETTSSFKEALKQEKNRKKQGWGPYYYYKEKGLYGKQLKKYFEYFSEENIKIIFFKNFKNNTQKVLENVFKFLEVDDNFTPEKKVYNASKVSLEKIYKEITSKNFLKKVFSKKLPKRIWRNLKDFKFSKNKLDKKTKKELYDFYKKDMEELEQLLENKQINWHYSNTKY